MRRENPVLVYGDLYYLISDDKKMVLAYSRKMGNEEIIAVFNRSDSHQTVILPSEKGAEYVDILSLNAKSYRCSDNGIENNLDPLTSIVLKKE